MGQVIEADAVAGAVMDGMPSGVAERASGRAPVSIATLLREDCAALEARFATARWDGPVTLEGHPTGYLLAVPGMERGVAASGVALAQRRWLNPWQGKSFKTTDNGEGIGTNRLRLFGVRFGAFRFKTYATNSVVDNKPAFAIDYDTPRTPIYAHATYDELRPIEPNLFLGRGMKRRPNKTPKLLCWFLLDLRTPDVPVKL